MQTVEYWSENSSRLFNVHSVRTVILGWSIKHQITSKNLIHTLFYKAISVRRGLGKMKLTEPGWQKLKKMHKLEVGDSCQAIFWLIPGQNERRYNGTGFSEQGSLLSASPVPQRGAASSVCLFWPSGPTSHRQCTILRRSRNNHSMAYACSQVLLRREVKFGFLR